MTEYIKNPLSGKLRGVTYEDGKIIDVHIRDTDDMVKVFVPVRHGRWVETRITRYNGDKPYTQFAHSCSQCKYLNKKKKGWHTNYCPNCGAKMDLEVTNDA